MNKTRYLFINGCIINGCINTLSIESTDSDLSITVSQKFFFFFQEWISQTLEKVIQNQHQISYKKDIFIFDYPLNRKDNVKLNGCFIKSLNHIDDKIKLVISYDFPEIGEFNELKQKIRDITLEELLG